MPLNCTDALFFHAVEQPRGLKSDMPRTILITGLLGLLASILVGAGEYLLHYDSLARFSAGGYDFLQGISASRSNAGHFLGVFGATLYPFGCYHIYLMLKPANSRLAFATFLIGTFGFMVGAVWIGSRASISALVQYQNLAPVQELMNLYELRYETLLWVVRITTLLISVIIVVMSVRGKTHYPRWIGLFNPIVMIIACFLVFLTVPSVGKHIMPIALNVAFFIFFSLSLLSTRRVK